MTVFKNLALIYLCRLSKSCFLLTASGVLTLLNPVAAKPLTTDSAAATVEQLGSQWLNQWGHSEINLTGNSSKTLQGSGMLLFPLLSAEQPLLFTQIGGHFEKTGNLLNIGIGQRWFTDQGHWGYNLFHDYHFKNHHRRLSLGLEWQHNHFSAAVNGYQPLTNKRLITDTPESKTFDRPARGFDLCCQYRLPQYPQLRLNLTGDRYLGEIVHNDSIVRNRSALTVGFDYTPIPIVTAGYGFNLDNARNKAHQLQLILTYRLGVPLAEQFEPQQVHSARASLSNRLDLVQRNQQIVLQQRVERQAPQTEDNDDSAPPQNTLEEIQGPEVDPPTKQDLIIAEIAAEQQRLNARAYAKESAKLRHLPIYQGSDAEIAAEQQRLNARAYAKESAKLRRLPIYQGSDAEIAAEQQRLNARAYAKESAKLRHLPIYQGSDAEIAAEQQRLNARAYAKESAKLRRLPIYQGSDAEIAAEQQRLNAHAYPIESTVLGQLTNYSNSDAEITTPMKHQASTYNIASDVSDTDYLISSHSSNLYQDYELFYMPDGETSAPDTHRSSVTSTESREFFDSDVESTAEQQCKTYAAAREAEPPKIPEPSRAIQPSIQNAMTESSQSSISSAVPLKTTPHTELPKCFPEANDSDNTEMPSTRAPTSTHLLSQLADNADSGAKTDLPQKTAQVGLQLNNSDTIHSQNQKEILYRSSHPYITVQPAHSAPQTQPRVSKPTLNYTKKVTRHVSSVSTDTEYGSEYEMLGRINPGDR